jgi:hypothetical protein
VPSTAATLAPLMRKAGFPTCPRHENILDSDLAPESAAKNTERKKGQSVGNDDHCHQPPASGRHGIVGGLIVIIPTTPPRPSRLTEFARKYGLAGTSSTRRFPRTR